MCQKEIVPTINTRWDFSNQIPYQFIDGQRDVTLRRELRTKLLLNPNISFADIKKEAIIRAEAYGEEEVAAQVNYTEQVKRSTPPKAALDKVKDELRNEIMGELRQQMSNLSKGIAL